MKKCHYILILWGWIKKKNSEKWGCILINIQYLGFNALSWIRSS